MNVKVLICLLALGATLGFGESLQAFKVKNQLGKSVSLTNFVYTFGTTSLPVGGTLTVAAGMTGATNQQQGSKAACTATIAGTTQTFNLSNLEYNDTVTFFKDNGTFQYSID